MIDFMFYFSVVIKCYGLVVVFDSVLLEIVCGEFFGLFGLNGVGKLMMMVFIVGLCVFDGGVIMFDGELLSVVGIVGWFFIGLVL